MEEEPPLASYFLMQSKCLCVMLEHQQLMFLSVTPADNSTKIL